MKALWDNALDRIRAQVSGENFSTYFEPLRFARVDGDAVCLTVDDPFFRDWVIEHYREVLEGAMSAVAGRAMSLQLDVAEAPSAPVLELPLPTRAAPVDEPEAFPLNPHYLFDQFVVGPNNEMAHAASRAVAERPARSFNPLFIYGGTGLGKTHLLHAIAHRIKAADPSKRIVYISAEEFTNQVIKSIARQTMDDFRRRFRARCDVLLMDDVHILSGKERTQEEFF
ncbi:MAG: AAA family ATPase, partial [Myxococcales bacterium]|nr:AAA family ATPase [Myxococcales bacterium]